MQTLNDSLAVIAKKYNKEVPYGRDLQCISMAIINAIKETGKYELVKKKKEYMEVNNYPTSLTPIVDEVIETYFADRNKILHVSRVIQRERKFTYIVEEYKTSAFESALTKSEIPIVRNEGLGNKEKAQYIIPVSSPAKLIRLGKLFQKERDQERKNRYLLAKKKIIDEQKARNYINHKS